MLGIFKRKKKDQGFILQALIKNPKIRTMAISRKEGGVFHITMFIEPGKYYESDFSQEILISEILRPDNFVEDQIIFESKSILTKKKDKL